MEFLFLSIPLFSLLRITVQNFCQSKCTKRILKELKKIINGIHHMHLLGKFPITMFWYQFYFPANIFTASQWKYNLTFCKILFIWHRNSRICWTLPQWKERPNHQWTLLFIWFPPKLLSKYQITLFADLYHFYYLIQHKLYSRYWRVALFLNKPFNLFYDDWSKKGIAVRRKYIDAEMSGMLLRC